MSVLTFLLSLLKFLNKLSVFLDYVCNTSWFNKFGHPGNPSKLNLVIVLLYDLFFLVLPIEFFHRPHISLCLN